MLLVDGICTVINVVIANLIRTNLVPCVITSCEVVTMVVILAKEELYHDWHPLDVFFTLAIEIFGCLHQ
jgi:hypothetical protein